MKNQQSGKSIVLPRHSVIKLTSSYLGGEARPDNPTDLPAAQVGPGGSTTTTTTPTLLPTSPSLLASYSTCSASSKSGIAYLGWYMANRLIQTTALLQQDNYSAPPAGVDFSNGEQLELASGVGGSGGVPNSGNMSLLSQYMANRLLEEGDHLRSGRSDSRRTSHPATQTSATWEPQPSTSSAMWSVSGEQELQEDKDGERQQQRHTRKMHLPLKKRHIQAGVSNFGRCKFRDSVK